MASRSVRGINFTPKETSTLIENIHAHKDVIFGKFSSKVTHQMKEDTWKSIKEKVNSHNVAPRTVKQIKKKWHDFSSRAKKKAAKIKLERPKTGNKKFGTFMTEIEQIAVQIIGEEGVYGLKDGIEEGVDDMDVSGNTDANHQR